MAQLMLVNPRKRRTKRKTTRKAVSRRRRNPVAKLTKRRTYRRNPLPKMDTVIGTLKDGALGAVGAVASEVVLSKLPLPAALSSGNGRVAASALCSIGIGMLVAKFGKNKALGHTMAKGGVTVALHSVIRGVAGNIPGVGLDGYDDGLLGFDDGLLGMGYYNAAPTYDPMTDVEGMGYYEDELEY